MFGTDDGRIVAESYLARNIDIDLPTAIALDITMFRTTSIIGQFLCQCRYLPNARQR